jgi:hypothetical protein
MDEELYWRIIEASLNVTKTQREQELFITQTLTDLSQGETIGFLLRTEKLLFDSYNSDLWCAACIMNGGFCSCDGFRYFRCWLISRGKAAYYNGLSNADSLESEINRRLKFYDFESFGYVAAHAFEVQTGKDVYDYIDENFSFNEGKYPAIQLTWSTDAPQTLRQVCPLLFERFAHSLH